MFTEVGQDDVGRRYFATRYKPGSLAKLPWGDEPFDCIIFLINTEEGQPELLALSIEVAMANVDWVQVAGSGSQQLHDAIDDASVNIGRQQAVGDGLPMTTWHDDALTIEEMAEVAYLCFGGHRRVLVVVVGQDQDFIASVAAVGNCLARDSTKEGM